MKFSKICFLNKIPMLKLVESFFLAPKHISMKDSKATLVAFTLATTVTSTSGVYADNEDTVTKEIITCATAIACKKLTEFIQAQIDELEKSDAPDFDRLDKLQTQLIATENQKQKQNSVLIDAIKKTDAQISGLRGALLEN